MNKTLMQYFEWDLSSDCQLWNQAASQAKELFELGITEMWFPPAYKDAYGKNGVGYAVYDMYDLGEFDQKGSIPTKYGTKQEYINAIHACHKAGMLVYADIVFNHRIGGDETEEIYVRECNPNNRSEIISQRKQISAWTKFTFPGRKNKYSNFTWNASHFDGTDWDANTCQKGIYLIDGKNWESDVDLEHGNYDYLMGADLDFQNEDVKRELYRWSKWYYDTTLVDGFRLDAVKHIGLDFYKEWKQEMEAYLGRNFFAVGEYWNSDISFLQNYLEKTGGLLSLFDVPLHYHFYEASIQKENYDMRTIFDHTLISYDAYHAITFVDNHDTQPGQALFSFVESWFKPIAYALILLRDAGTPCIFYGDYYGISSKSIAPVGKQLLNLINIRSTHAYGTQHDYFDERNCVGFTREGIDDEAQNQSYETTSLACVISTNKASSRRMYIGKMHAGQKYLDACRNCSNIVKIDSDGYGDFFVKEKSVSVWIPI